MAFKMGTSSMPADCGHDDGNIILIQDLLARRQLTLIFSEEADKPRHQLDITVFIKAKRRETSLRVVWNVRQGLQGGGVAGRRHHRVHF
jgi:hypothetical protein